MSLVVRYSALLQLPGVRRALTASIIGRLSIAMTGLSTLLLVSGQTGSYATAGAVSGAFSLAFSVGAPYVARVADRRGPIGVLRLCSVLHPIALIGLGIAARGGAPTAVLLLTGALAGVSFPPIGSVMRALWGTVTHGRQLVTAYSLESVAVEVSFVSGPALVGLVVLLASPFVALLLSAGMALVGGIGLTTSSAVRAVRPHPGSVHSATGPLASAAVRSLLLTVFFLGVAFGALEVGVPAFAEQESHRAAAGLLLALWSLGSMVGGLIYGGVHLSAPAIRQLPWLIGALAVTALLPVLAPNLWLMGAAVFIFGSSIAPFFSANSLLLGFEAPPGTTTEAFAWGTSMIFGGAAVGAALAGYLVQNQSVPLALSVTAVAGTLTLASGLAGRRRLSTG
ncbi:MAG: MFS transporter [Mycobacteriales bacterium]